MDLEIFQQMKIKVVAPIRYGLEDQSCLPSQMSCRPHELLMWQVSQELKAFFSLRFDAPVLALCVDGFPLALHIFCFKKSGNRDSILEFVGMLNSSSEAVIVTEQGVANKTRAANVMKNS